MLRSILAGLLIVLTVLPFTAPFPACDASGLFGDQVPVSAAHEAQNSSVIDGSLSHALPLSGFSTRTRFIARLDTWSGHLRSPLVRVSFDSPVTHSASQGSQASRSVLRI